MKVLPLNDLQILIFFCIFFCMTIFGTLAWLFLHLTTRMHKLEEKMKDPSFKTFIVNSNVDDKVQNVNGKFAFSDQNKVDCETEITKAGI